MAFIKLKKFFPFIALLLSLVGKVILESKSDYDDTIWRAGKAIELPRASNHRGEKACGEIELVVYGIESFRVGGMPLDKVFNLRHLGLRICDIEFHFGYERLISICESPAPQMKGKGASTKIICTNEMNPEFRVENGRRRIKEQYYLKFGQIVRNIKEFKSEKRGTYKLIDVRENPMETKLSLKDIVEMSLNGNLRRGQNDFPQVTMLTVKDIRNLIKPEANGGNENANGNKHFIVELKSKSKSELYNYELPNYIKNFEEWNKKVAEHRKGKTKLSGDAKKLYEELIELGEKLSAQKKIEENGADGIKAKADVTNLANNEEENHLIEWDKEEIVWNKEEEEKSPAVGTENNGRFGHGTYDMFLNNCADFVVNLLLTISPEQECNWPKVASQTLPVIGIRFFSTFVKRVHQIFSKLMPNYGLPKHPNQNPKHLDRKVAIFVDKEEEQKVKECLGIMLVSAATSEVGKGTAVAGLATPILSTERIYEILTLMHRYPSLAALCTMGVGMGVGRTSNANEQKNVQP